MSRFTRFVSVVAPNRTKGQVVRRSQVRRGRRLGLSALSLIVLVATSSAIGATALDSVAITGQSITRLDFNGTASDYGEFTLTFDLDSLAVPFVYANVLADLNDDAAFGDYAASGNTQTEWIVRNVPIYIQPDSTVTQSMTFPLIDAGVLFDNDVGLEMFLSETPQAIGALTVPDVATNALFGSGDRLLVEPGKDGPIGPLTPDDPSGTGYLGEFLTDTNITTITDFKLNLFTPDIAQDPNECGPTSAANSLRWLAETHGFEDMIPETDSELIDELVTDMSTSSITGTSDSNMVNGKKKFIEDNDLPIEVEYRDGNTTINGQEQEKPSTAFIWDALAKGKDIEMGFTFTGANGGGHWVTLVGGIHYSDGTFGVYVHDPDDGKTSTVYYELELRDDGYLEMVGYGSSHFIDIVVTEAYIPTPAALPAGLLALVAIAARRTRFTRR